MRVPTLLTIGLCALWTGEALAAGPIGAKDGSGTGANSWIGYTAGNNIASGTGSAVAAGTSNAATGANAFVGAGSNNTADGISSLVIGGFDNHATAIDSLVGAGAGNRATGARSVIVGGGYNLANGQWSFIGGGGRDGIVATPAGTDAKDHIALAKWSTIGGGQGNRAGSAAAQTGATVAGGETNQALNTDATVGGGVGNTASGLAATVPGGNANVAGGTFSFAAGNRAKANNNGSFAFADGTAFDFTSAADNEFAARATGGVRFVSAVNGSGVPIAGVTLAAGAGSWATLSDRAAKRDLAPADPAVVLAKVGALPIYTWRYASETSGALHMGPVAQDFHAAFGLGPDAKTIATVDADGVALAAIQGMLRRVERKSAEIEAQAAELDDVARRIERLEAAQGDYAALKAAVAQLLRERDTTTQARLTLPTR